ncbi:hypothetical protein BJY04DRAFT_224372 [Aspergillus karnatakaensis]|uniref:uncharacterized protein n=1 Tax=Aspergillus karnatakaensis TaxID=1810916 RepID=UPI003CCD571A
MATQEPCPPTHEGNKCATCDVQDEIYDLMAEISKHQTQLKQNMDRLKASLRETERLKKKRREQREQRPQLRRVSFYFGILDANEGFVAAAGFSTVGRRRSRTAGLLCGVWTVLEIRLGGSTVRNCSVLRVGALKSQHRRRLSPTYVSTFYIEKPSHYFSIRLNPRTSSHNSKPNGSPRNESPPAAATAKRSALSIVGAAMARQISPDNVWARFMGYCLANAYSVSFLLTLAMSTGNVGGYMKRVTVNAMVCTTQCLNTPSEEPSPVAY